MRLYFDKELTFEKFSEIMAYRPSRIYIPTEEGEKIRWAIEEYHFPYQGDCMITYTIENILGYSAEVCKATLRDVFPFWLYLGLEGAFIELPSEIGTGTNHSILKAYSKEQLQFIPQKRFQVLPIASTKRETYNMRHIRLGNKFAGVS